MPGLNLRKALWFSRIGSNPTQCLDRIVSHESGVIVQLVESAEMLYHSQWPTFRCHGSNQLTQINQRCSAWCGLYFSILSRDAVDVNA